MSEDTENGSLRPSWELPTTRQGTEWSSRKLNRTKYAMFSIYRANYKMAAICVGAQPLPPARVWHAPDCVAAEQLLRNVLGTH